MHPIINSPHFIWSNRRLFEKRLFECQIKKATDVFVNILEPLIMPNLQITSTKVQVTKDYVIM